MSFVQLLVICGKFLLAADGDAWAGTGREGEPTACGPLLDSLSAADRGELAMWLRHLREVQGGRPTISARKAASSESSG
jgi:hypothetical protein